MSDTLPSAADDHEHEPLPETQPEAHAPEPAKPAVIFPPEPPPEVIKAMEENPGAVQEWHFEQRKARHR